MGNDAQVQDDDDVAYFRRYRYHKYYYNRDEKCYWNCMVFFSFFISIFLEL